MLSYGCHLARVTISAALCGVALDPLGAAELASAWSTDKSETKSRLLAGDAAGKTMGAVEISLADGWKTYWRFPGDAGGIPPTFDWSKSDNVASVKVLYPIPKRMTDKAGDTLGYKSSVVLPVVIEPKDAAKPVALDLTLEYGICKDVCIPVEAHHSLAVPVGPASPLPGAAIAALDLVPRAGSAVKPADPKVLKTEVKLEGGKPLIAIEAEFPGGTDGAEAYVESPDGYYIPLPKSGSAKALGPNQLRFEIDLTGATDPADLKGKSAMVTLVSKQGLSETTFKLD